MPTIARAEAKIMLQGFLRLLPKRLAHDGGHRPRDGRALPAAAAFSVDMLALVDRADQQIAHAPGLPWFGGMRARHSQAIQILSDAGTGLALFPGHAKNPPDQFGFRNLKANYGFVRDHQAGWAGTIGLAIAEWGSATQPAAAPRDTLRAGQRTFPDDLTFVGAKRCGETPQLSPQGRSRGTPARLA